MFMQLIPLTSHLYSLTVYFERWVSPVRASSHKTHIDSWSRAGSFVGIVEKKTSLLWPSYCCKSHMYTVCPTFGCLPLFQIELKRYERKQLGHISLTCLWWNVLYLYTQGWLQFMNNHWLGCYQQMTYGDLRATSMKGVHMWQNTKFWTWIDLKQINT